jgi:hypothetical protein
MMNLLLWASALAGALLIVPALASAAATPKPMPMPSITLPNKPLHVQLIVEVNKKGQVVRVEHGTLSGDQSYDTMTLGNAMQMWIRRPDGSAQAGLYRVTYDYDPHTHDVARVPTLMKPGGNWADRPGAATLIIQEARRQLREAQARLKAEQQKQRQQSEKNLPDINAAVKRAVASPKPTAKP